MWQHGLLLFLVSLVLQHFFVLDILLMRSDFVEVLSIYSASIVLCVVVYWKIIIGVWFSCCFWNQFVLIWFGEIWKFVSNCSTALVRDLISFCYLQNVHQGHVIETLIRFLKAREWNASKAHKMVCFCWMLCLLNWLWYLIFFC